MAQAQRSTRVQRFWKGRIVNLHNANDPKWEGFTPDKGMAFICAHSTQDAIRLVEEYTGKPLPRNELKVYFHEGDWGLPMKGITPERGIWISFGPTGERTAPIKMT